MFNTCDRVGGALFTTGGDNPVDTTREKIMRKVLNMHATGSEEDDETFASEKGTVVRRKTFARFNLADDALARDFIRGIVAVLAS